jgi:hypothetical protein
MSTTAMIRLDYAPISVMRIYASYDALANEIASAPEYRRTNILLC